MTKLSRVWLRPESGKECHYRSLTAAVTMSKLTCNCSNCRLRLVRFGSSCRRQWQVPAAMAFRRFFLIPISGGEPMSPKLIAVILSVVVLTWGATQPVVAGATGYWRFEGDRGAPQLTKVAVFLDLCWAERRAARPSSERPCRNPERPTPSQWSSLAMTATRSTWVSAFRSMKMILPWKVGSTSAMQIASL